MISITKNKKSTFALSRPKSTGRNHLHPWFCKKKNFLRYRSETQERRCPSWVPHIRNGRGRSAPFPRRGDVLRPFEAGGGHWPILAPLQHRIRVRQGDVGAGWDSLRGSGRRLPCLRGALRAQRPAAPLWHVSVLRLPGCDCLVVFLRGHAWCPRYFQGRPR